MEQIWEYGKNRGNEWFYPVTSLTQYEPDKDSIMVYSATLEWLLILVKV